MSDDPDKKGTTRRTFMVGGAAAAAGAGAGRIRAGATAGGTAARPARPAR